MESEKRHDTRDLRDVQENELGSIAGGVAPVYDENGEIIADCTGRLVKIGSATIWVPHGTIVFGSTIG